MKQIKCGKAEELVVRDLDEGLDPGDKERLENHLRTCSACVRMREEFQLVLRAAASDAPPMPDEHFWKRYDSSLEALIREKSLSKQQRWRWQVVVPIVAMAAIFVIALFSVPIDRQYSGKGQLASSSDAVIDELNQAFGPSQEELSPSPDRGITMVLSDNTDDGTVDWFEVEDEPSQMLL